MDSIGVYWHRYIVIVQGIHSLLLKGSIKDINMYIEINSSVIIFEL
jgi:hypothetical protein